MDVVQVGVSFPSWQGLRKGGLHRPRPVVILALWGSMFVLGRVVDAAVDLLRKGQGGWPGNAHNITTCAYS